MFLALLSGVSWEIRLFVVDVFSVDKVEVSLCFVCSAALAISSDLYCLVFQNDHIAVVVKCLLGLQRYTAIKVYTVITQVHLLRVRLPC